MIPKDKKQYPVPEYGVQVPRYPFHEMEIGESFTFPKEKSKSVASAAKHWAKKTDNDHEFIVRVISDTQARCWRVA